MKRQDFYYDLPEDRIAQQPPLDRDQARLLLLWRSDPTMRHQRFFEIERWFHPTDVLVLNVTRVFPARLRGKKKTGGKAEVLLLEPLDPGAQRWRALVRGSVKAVDLVFPEGLEGSMKERFDNGEWAIHFSRGGVRDYLRRHGEMPLPPYIKRDSRQAEDLERYQTVFARDEGAVAAPTAGFHFTAPLLQRLKDKGVLVLDITLHVGWGTFRPIRTDTVENHAMLPESFDVSESAAQSLTDAKLEGRRIVAVGTTVVRTLETICDSSGVFHPGRGQSKLFIYPGYHFKAIDALITNFHLPDSTPLLLANAFYAQGSSFSQREKVAARPDEGHPPHPPSGHPLLKGEGKSPFVLKPAYEEAIRQGYRFYSYGDAMFIQ